MIDNESDDPATLAYLEGLPLDRCRVLRIASEGGRFNYARLNNRAVEQLDHDYIVFLNNDTEVRRPEWLSQLVGYAQIPGVGAVGARLLFPDGRVQHAGVVTGVHEGMPIHAFKLLPWWDGGYMGHALAARNYSAVTAACLLTPRELFRSTGRLRRGAVRRGLQRRRLLPPPPRGGPGGASTPRGPSSSTTRTPRGARSTTPASR